MNKTNYNLRLGELNTCANQCCTIANEYNSAMTEALFATIITLIQTLADNLNDALKRGRVMSNLDELDRRRGKAFTLLRNMVISFTCYPASQQHIVDAARRVMDVLNRYRSIRRQNYSEQSAWIDSLLNDLREDSVAADLASLPGINVAVTELTDAETTFATARIDYHKRFRDRGLSASELKRTLLRAINQQLVPFLNAMAVTDYQTWGELAARISDVIDEHNETVRRRKAGSNEEEIDVETEVATTDETQPVETCTADEAKYSATDEAKSCATDKAQQDTQCVATPAYPIPSEEQNKSSSLPLVGNPKIESGTRQDIAMNCRLSASIGRLPTRGNDVTLIVAGDGIRAPQD